MPSDGVSESRAFHALANARVRELEGWPEVAAILSLLEGTDWWKPYGENEVEAFAAPEIQMPKTTAHQYRRIWKYFGTVPPERLERVRPRLLYQACRAVENGADIWDVIADAEALSWFSFIQKYRPEKNPFPSSEGT